MVFLTSLHLIILASITTTATQFNAFPGYTVQLEKIKKLAAIKIRILKKIGLKDRPFVGKPVTRLTKPLLRGHLKNTISAVSRPRGEYYAEIQEVVSHSQIPENTTDANVIQFKVVRDNQGRKLEVTSANLLVKIKYKRRKRGSNKRRRRLKLKQISLKLSNVDSKGKPSELVASITTKIRGTKWLKVPVPATLIETAMQREDQNLYLHLDCDGCDKAAQLILINGRRNKMNRRKRRDKRKRTKGMRELKVKRTRRRKRRLNRTRPFLILHTRVKTYIRSKRDTVICTTNSTCCMENLHVNFNSIGWADWIIAPKSFETGVCQGACSNNNTNCQETKSTHLRIVFIDQNGNIIFTSLPNMIVTECGCSSDK